MTAWSFSDAACFLPIGAGAELRGRSFGLSHWAEFSGSQHGLLLLVFLVVCGATEASPTVFGVLFAGWQLFLEVVPGSAVDLGDA